MTFTAPNGDKMIILPENDYLQLISNAEDVSDLKAAQIVIDNIKNGDDEFIPLEMALQLSAELMTCIDHTKRVGAFW